ncbi:MAG: RNA 2',3'-cyclic phosphodiesterase [Candidatus Omnitrophota bacterium]
MRQIKSGQIRSSFIAPFSLSQMEDSIRAFIAVELDQDLRTALGEIQKDLRKTGADVKWVKPDNIHLTLKFLGQTSLKKIDAIIQIMQSCVKSNHAFSIEPVHLGAFPRIENPQVIWLGIENGKQDLLQIASCLDEKLTDCGFERENRAFQAHMTLGRLRSSLNKLALTKAIKNFSYPKTIRQPVRSVSLIKSTLTPQGPIYETITNVPLLISKE